MSRCIRCRGRGTVVVHEVSVDSATGRVPAGIYACDTCAAQIEAEQRARAEWTAQAERDAPGVWL